MKGKRTRPLIIIRTSICTLRADESEVLHKAPQMILLHFIVFILGIRHLPAAEKSIPYIPGDVALHIGVIAHVGAYAAFPIILVAVGDIALCGIHSYKIAPGAVGGKYPACKNITVAYVFHKNSIANDKGSRFILNQNSKPHISYNILRYPQTAPAHRGNVHDPDAPRIKVGIRGAEGNGVPENLGG